MGGFSLWHWLVVGLVILLLFGRGRFSEMMGDVAKGLKNFKKGMSEEDEVPGAPPRQLGRDGPTVGERPIGERPVEPAVVREPASVPERPVIERDADRRV